MNFRNAHERITGAHAPDAVRHNVILPTAEQVITELSRFKDGYALQRSFSPAEMRLLNEKMLKFAPLTPRQESAKARYKKAKGKDLKVTRRLEITALGLKYLEWLEMPRALLAPVDVSRLRLQQAFVAECVLAPIRNAAMVAHCAASWDWAMMGGAL